jgi:hypothetical protein
MALIADISGYVLVIRGDMKILAIILSDKIMHCKRLFSKIMEIKLL